jgi:hypothetical protein
MRAKLFCTATIPLLGALIAFACGEDFQLEPSSDAGDAGDAASDAPSTEKRCEVTGRFGDPKPVPIDGMPAVVAGGLDDDRSPHLTPDELTIVFMSRRESPGPTQSPKLYIADRADRKSAFNAPRVIPVGPGTNSEPMISADGLRVFFTTLRGNNASIEIYVVTRSARDTPFGTAEPLPRLNTAFNEFQPFESSAGLWFTSDRPDSDAGDAGPFRMWFAPQSLNKPELVRDVGGGGIDGVPTPTSDERALYFASDRPGGQGKGDIWVVRRAQPYGAFDENTLTRVSELATEFNEAPGWVSPDNCRLYFERSRSVAAPPVPTSLFIASRDAN